MGEGGGGGGGGDHKPDFWSHRKKQLTQEKEGIFPFPSIRGVYGAQNDTRLII
jgi:hypothetical protein